MEDKKLANPMPQVPDAPPTTKTIGEKIWNTTTYVGVNYLANLALSLVIWDFCKSGHGRHAVNGFATSASEVLKAFGMDAVHAERGAQTAAVMACSPLGGHVTMVPVKYLEDHARYITHRLNQMLDGNYKYKDLQATIDTPEADLPALVDEPNKQSWGQIAARRALAWASVTAAGTALNQFQNGKYHDMLESNTIKGTNKLIDLTGSTSLKKLSQTQTFERYNKLFALDMYFTVITSAVVAATKRMFGEGTEIAEIHKHPEVLCKPTVIIKNQNTLSKAPDDLVARASFVEALNRHSPDHHLSV